MYLGISIIDTMISSSTLYNEHILGRAGSGVVKSKNVEKFVSLYKG
jgi:hypothetical protein